MFAGVTRRINAHFSNRDRRCMKEAEAGYPDCNIEHGVAKEQI